MLLHPHTKYEPCPGGCEDLREILDRLTVLERPLIPLNSIQKFALLLSSDLTALRVVMILLNLLVAVAFSITAVSSDTHDIVYMLSILPWYVWSGIFILIAVSRTYNMFVLKPSNKLKILIAVIGILVWGMLLASGLVVGPYENMTLIYIVPCLIETWILGHAFGYYRR